MWMHSESHLCPAPDGVLWSYWWSPTSCRSPLCRGRASRCSWWASPPAAAPSAPRWSDETTPRQTAAMTTLDRTVEIKGSTGACQSTPAPPFHTEGDLMIAMCSHCSLPMKAHDRVRRSQNREIFRHLIQYFVEVTALSLHTLCIPGSCFN